MDPIAKTSLLTAAMRAAETKLNDRLFADPYAELLAGDEGTTLLQKALEESGPQPAIAIRTAFIDEKITNAVNKGVRQIVMLAAGMDTRAYRLQIPRDCTIFELDRKEVLNYKKEKLTDAKPICMLKFLPVDLTEDWIPILQKSGFKKEQTLWLVEGVLIYLDPPHVATLFEKIDSLALPKDILICDIANRLILESPYMEKQLQFLKSIGAPWLFGINEEPETFCDRIGWNANVTQACEYAPTRWPFPAAPRNVPSIPRVFYIEAIKK